MVLGKNVAIFYWEWGRNSAPVEGQKIPCVLVNYSLVCLCLFGSLFCRCIKQMTFSRQNYWQDKGFINNVCSQP